MAKRDREQAFGFGSIGFGERTVQPRTTLDYPTSSRTTTMDLVNPLGMDVNFNYGKPEFYTRGLFTNRKGTRLRKRGFMPKSMDMKRAVLGSIDIDTRRRGRNRKFMWVLRRKYEPSERQRIAWANAGRRMAARRGRRYLGPYENAPNTPSMAAIRGQALNIQI